MPPDVFANTPKQAIDKVHAFMRFELQYPGFLKIMATKIVNETILDEIHRRQESLGFSKKIIERTYITNIKIESTGEMTFDCISDYESESGFDVAKAREEGTDVGKPGHKHWVAPVHRKFLSWIQNGVRRFSPGHWVKGITRSNVIKKTIKEMTPKAQARLDEETDKLLEKILKS